MSQDEILQNTRSVVQSLEALKNEHANMIKNLNEKLDTHKSEQTTRTIIEEEISILRNSDEMVHLGISEASVLIQLSNYLQSIEAEKQKIKSQVKRLCQENAWLRDELAAAQKKLQESEQYSAQIEVELSHLKFLKELKKFDEDLNAQQQQQQQQYQQQIYYNGILQTTPQIIATQMVPGGGLVAMNNHFDNQFLNINQSPRLKPITILDKHMLTNPQIGGGSHNSNGGSNNSNKKANRNQNFQTRFRN